MAGPAPSGYRKTRNYLIFKRAQDANPLSTEAKQAYTAIKNNLQKMAEKMPEENYDFKPSPEIRTFGALVAHVADAQAGICSPVKGEPKSVGAASKKTKAELVAVLKESFEICDAAYDSVTDATAGESSERGDPQASPSK